MNIARLEKRDPEEHGPVLPDLGDPPPSSALTPWCGIGSLGTVREVWYESEAETVRDGLHLRRRKERRG